ncbi:MAG: DHH family phosphoesterase [Thermoplasmata archaeon]
MEKRARTIANTIISLAERMGSNFYIVAHADADGIASAAIISHIIQSNESKIQPNVEFLDDFYIDPMRYSILKSRMKSPQDEIEGIWIFTDLGQGSLHHLGRIKRKIVIDHHHIAGKNSGKIQERDADFVLSPLQFGRSSGYSASHLAYMIARNVTRESVLPALALIGTLGDEIQRGEFVAPAIATEILEACRKSGEITVKKDLVIPGKETLTLDKLILEMNQLLKMNFHPETIVDEICSAARMNKKDISTRKWVHLKHSEKQKILSCIAKKRLRMGCSPEKALDMVGDVYHFKRHPPETHLHDCVEFAHLLNQCTEPELARAAYELCQSQNEEKYREILKMCSKPPSR